MKLSEVFANMCTVTSSLKAEQKFYLYGSLELSWRGLRISFLTVISFQTSSHSDNTIQALFELLKTEEELNNLAAVP